MIRTEALRGLADRSSARHRRRYAGDTWDANSVVASTRPNRISFAEVTIASPYRCGAAAANKLDVFIAHRSVYCTPKDIDRYGRTVASCRAGVTDLGEWLVDGGVALEWPRYSKGRFGAAQRAAERAGRGMWAGSYIEPWQYRECVRAGGRPAQCSDDATAHLS
jgi:endonuclease YncB( thermonuclease family)